MKIILEITGRQYRLIRDAVEKDLKEARKDLEEIDEYSDAYDNISYKVFELSDLYSKM